MRKIVVTEFITLDGVVEDPGGSEDHPHGGWSFLYPAETGYAFKFQELQDAGSQLLGRVTYDGFAAAWPERDDEAGFAARMNSMPKHVVSTTLHEATWENTSIISGDDVPGQIAALKEEGEGDILVAGSITLVNTLLQHDLVDQLNLMVFPIVLGSGKKLFGDSGDLLRFTLTSSQQLPTGTLINVYARARD
jgi:dihydrofolate reductase